jgi:putative membrane protein
MKSANKLFSESERDDVRRAVQTAESKTSAEIVPVVATASGRFDRAEDMFGFLFALLLLTSLWLLFQTQSDGPWGQTELAITLPMIIGILVVGWVRGVAISSRGGWVKRLPTSVKQQASEVAESAAKCFYDGRIHHKENSAGVIIYVSLLEHMVVIKADKNALAALNESDLDNVKDVLLTNIRKEGIKQALIDAIEEVGCMLSEKLPSTEQTSNELPDALILID